VPRRFGNGVEATFYNRDIFITLFASSRCEDQSVALAVLAEPAGLAPCRGAGVERLPNEPQASERDRLSTVIVAVGDRRRCSAPTRLRLYRVAERKSIDAVRKITALSHSVQRV
jgi:hypothetical protein